MQDDGMKHMCDGSEQRKDSMQSKVYSIYTAYMGVCFRLSAAQVAYLGFSF